MVTGNLESLKPGARRMGWDELNRAGESAYENGLYSEAEQHLTQAVKEAQGDQTALATSLFNLGRVYIYLEEYSKAEASLTRAMAIRGKVFGLEHVEIARVIDILGTVYLNEEKYAEAEPLFKRALEMRVKLLGEEDADVAESWVSMGALYERQKKYVESEASLREALRQQEKLLGPEHKDLAPTLGLLAVLRLHQDMPSDAISIAQRAVEIRERQLGHDHPALAVSLQIVAMAYFSQKKFAEALPVYERVLVIRKRYLTMDHALISAILRPLGVIYTRMGRFDEAVAVFQQLQTTAENGGRLDDLMIAMRELSSIYVLERKYHTGEAYIAEALDKLSAYGEKADKTKEGLNLSLFYCLLGQRDFFRAAKICPDVARITYNALRSTGDTAAFRRRLKMGVDAIKGN